jgi:predicted ATPase
MKLDIEVENLGKLKKGTVKVRPLTVLTGENGTGKSFFTKSLYSVFSVLNKNSLHLEIIEIIKIIRIDLDAFISQVQRKSKAEDLMVNDLDLKLDIFKEILELFKDENIKFYLKKVQESYKPIDKLINKFNKHLKKIEKNPIKIKFVKDKVKKLQLNLLTLNLYALDEKSYAKLLSKNLSNEIKENFQIKTLSELISFDEKKCQIIDKEHGLNISFDKNNFVDFSLQHNFIDEVFNFDRVVFFESPTYWSVRDAFHMAKNSKEENELTGVPKYFYDLDKTLNKKLTSSIDPLIDLAKQIKKEIKGEFTFNNGQLTFADNNNRDIDKNLISFGMTNLGIIQALLKNNVISKGSFVFFDEPETNLHPQWQVLLTKILVKLAESGVNVVMATHSLDMIKALEVYTKGKNDDFIAVNHFTKDGALFEFSNEGRYGEPSITENLIESRNELTSAYEDLFLSELYDGNE